MKLYLYLAKGQTIRNYTGAAIEVYAWNGTIYTIQNGEGLHGKEELEDGDEITFLPIEIDHEV